MRLYIRPIAPNALKVIVFMAERGIVLETVDVEGLSDEITAGSARFAPFRRSMPAMASSSPSR